MSLLRLDQWLTRCGVASRKQATALIQRGLVTVDGLPSSSNQRVSGESVLVRGKPLEFIHGLTVLFYKPLDCVCSHDPNEGVRIYDHLPEQWLERHPAPSSAGRLDADTTGALIITDDGSLIQKLTSPKHHLEKVYLVTLDRPVPEELVEVFASGKIQLHHEKHPCLPATLEILPPIEGISPQARLTLTEGKYHQVKRMFASQGLKVTALHREKIGPFDLADLKPGEWKPLDAAAVQEAIQRK